MIHYTIEDTCHGDLSVELSHLKTTLRLLNEQALGTTPEQIDWEAVSFLFETAEKRAKDVANKFEEMARSNLKEPCQTAFDAQKVKIKSLLESLTISELFSLYGETRLCSTILTGALNQPRNQSNAMTDALDPLWQHTLITVEEAVKEMRHRSPANEEEERQKTQMLACWTVHMDGYEEDDEQTPTILKAVS